MMIELILVGIEVFVTASVVMIIFLILTIMMVVGLVVVIMW